MAQRRMFSPKVTSTDRFLDMPVSARELYFQLGMNADDDGFIAPKGIMRMIGASSDDLGVLVAKNFVIPFQSGVIVITGWHINNLVRKDWYQETMYKNEKSLLSVDSIGEYKLVNNPLTDCQQLVNNSSTEVRLGKVILGKDNINNTRARKNENDQLSTVVNKTIDAPEYSPSFLQVWDNIYPHQSDAGSKVRAWKNWCKLLKEGLTEDELTNCASNYKRLVEAKHTTYTYKCSNFYGQDRHFEQHKVVNLTKINEELKNGIRKSAAEEQAERAIRLFNPTGRKVQSIFE